jgi:exodeoxyribonuclease V gamma subunit
MADMEKNGESNNLKFGFLPSVSAEIIDDTERIKPITEVNNLKLGFVSGNDLITLADVLGEELFSSATRPFENRIVVVPDASFKDFLFHRFAAHPRLQIAAGVQVLPLNQAVMEILDGVSMAGDRKRIPSFLELTLAIEEKLHRLLCDHMLTPGVQALLPLLDYLNVQDEEKTGRRIATLSDELARCFSRYGLYGKQFLPGWLALEGWQQALWKVLFSEESSWTYPLESLKQVKADCFQGKVALFGFSYLCPAHLNFFCSVSATLYQLSPCALFWGDFTSDKERIFTHRHLQRQGGKEKLCEELDQYMQQRHPLLGNWGKLGREMLKALDGFLLNEKEVYCEEEKGHLLCKLRQSLLTLDESEHLQLDRSLQLHTATSKLREVEVLRDSLETLLQTHHAIGDPIRPSEILVVSPDMPGYAPYIQMVFSESSFAYAIEGMPFVSVSEAAQGFLQLIQLPEQKYALNALLKLMRCLSFQERRGFASNEVDQLSKWFEEAQIRRGISDNPNSWEEGFDRLLCGLAMIPGEETVLETWPVACIQQSEIVLLNRFLEFFSELRADLAAFSGKKSASEWLALFVRIADQYFLIESEKEPFFQELKSLALSCGHLKEEQWNFDSIARVLRHLLQKPAGKIASHKLEKIVFVPLSQGNGRAPRIIWCLGMDEGSFPRSSAPGPLCAMSKLKGSDYYPLKADEDRSLFLEMLTKARDYFIFSYQRIHPEDGKYQGPSLLIEELDQYLQKRGIPDGMIKTDHPAFPFESVYFAPDAKVKKWSDSDYLAAIAHYFPQGTISPFFTPKIPLTSEPEEIVIDIRQLKKLARNPLQFYFNETLKIYLRDEEDEEETEFLISHLRKSMLRKRALQIPLAHVLREIRAQGKLPRGLFQNAAVAELEEEVEDLLKELSGFGVRPDQIYSIHFSSSCRSEENYRPALAVPLSDSKVVYIIGKLEGVTPKGLLEHAEGDLKSLVKVWPLYLIYRCLSPENRFLLLTKKGAAVELPVSDPMQALASYLDYFLLARQRLSPLLPDWAKAVLQGGEEDFGAALSKDINDPYLNYLKRRKSLFDPGETLSLWSTPLKKAFFPLIKEGSDADL